MCPLPLALSPWLAFALVACSSASVRLPAPLPRPAAGLPPGDAAQGRAGLTDRTRARSGLACLDCHRVHADGPIRPAPDLHSALSRQPLWRGRAADLSQAIGLCIERYQARVAQPREVAALQAGLADPPPAAARVGDLYDQACRHCHEGGPAGPLLGRPWPHAVIRDRLRGLIGPKTPDRFMPRFAPAVLSEQALSALLARLDQAGQARVGSRPDE